MPEAIPITKFSIPPIYSDMVPRPRLLARLRKALECRLTLIAAPAGFGKTTLLTEWLQHLPPKSAAWFSLDEDDNDRQSFWHNLVAALQSVLPQMGISVRAALETPQPTSFEILLSALINELAALPKPVIVVLDDYHLITADEVHRSLNFWLDHLPPGIHTIITTRQDPPLALPRRRARGDMLEIRAADLRFRPEETGAFLNQAAGVNVSTEDAAALAERTEGWAAGLRLAAISIQNLPQAEDRRRFVATFAGNDRYVVDYLGEEVFHHQSPALQNFLLRTAILDQLCGPLCNAVTEGNNAQEILEEIETRGLFLLPLDQQRHWYRYHGLFRDLLRQRLERTLSGAQIAALYLRASAWCENEGLVAEAVHYAIASGEMAFAAEQIERYALEIFYRSEIALVRKWLKALPMNMLHARPLLAALYGNILALEANSPAMLERADTWLHIAEDGLAQSSTPPGLTAGFVATFRAYLKAFHGAPPEEVLALCQQAWDSLPPSEQRFRSALANRMGMAYKQLGDHDAARQALLQARDSGLDSGDLFNAAGAIYFLAELIRQRGDLYQAAQIAQQGLDRLQIERQGAAVPYIGMIYLSLGNVLLEWNDLPAAEQALQKTLPLVSLTAITLGQAETWMAIAQLRQAQGNIPEALRALEQAERLAAGISEEINAWRVRFWLVHDPHAAVEWANSHALNRQLAGQYHPEQLAVIRVSIAHPDQRICRREESLAFLDEQIHAAEMATMGGWRLQALILKARLLQLLEDIPQSIATFQQAMDWAAPHGFTRSFLDEGADVECLLRRVTTHVYSAKLLAAFQPERPAAPDDVPSSAGVVPSTAAIKPLPEPLTRREIEVLQAVAAGDANPEIARKLYISIYTVKKHVTNIFGKLGVVNRVQAVKRGRELRLI